MTPFLMTGILVLDIDQRRPFAKCYVGSLGETLPWYWVLPLRRTAVSVGRGGGASLSA